MYKEKAKLKMGAKETLRHKLVIANWSYGILLLWLITQMTIFFLSVHNIFDIWEILVYIPCGEISMALTKMEVSKDEIMEQIKHSKSPAYGTLTLDLVEALWNDKDMGFVICSYKQQYILTVTKMLTRIFCSFFLKLKKWETRETLRITKTLSFFLMYMQQGAQIKQNNIL